MERFWSKVNKTDSCWEWTASKYHNGYGQFSIGKKKLLAHRFSWVLHNGPFLGNNIILHTCDNPSCVNPKHLILGTQKDNMNDMYKKGRQGDTSNHGINHGRAKLTEEQVLDIRSRKNYRGLGVALSKEFKVSTNQISYIRNFKQWRFLSNTFRK